MSQILEMTPPAAEVEQKIRAINVRLEGLRNRRTRAEAELNRLTHEENKLIRIFAEADGKEKAEIRGRVDVIAQERSDRERDMSGLAAAIAEAERERTALLPEFEREWTLRAAQERKKKLQELWAAHEANQKRIQDCEKALDDARVLANQSFFAFTAFRDQQFINEQLAAQEAL